MVLWDGFVYEVASHLGEEPLAFGEIDGKHWTVVFTLRGEVFRLISARRSRKKEIEVYENQKNHG